MIRFIRRTASRTALINLFIFALLLAAMLTVAAGMADLVRGLAYQDLAVLMSAALLVGWVLAGSSIRWILWMAAGLVSGWLFVIIQVGRLGPLVLRWALVLFRFAFAAIRWRWAGPPNPGPLNDQSLEIVQVILTLARRLAGWLAGLPDSFGAYDLIVAALIWSFLLWLVAYWAGGVLRRWRMPVVSHAPAGAVLAASLAYSAGDATYLVPFLGATLLLQVVLRIWELDRRWPTHKVDYPEDIWVDMGAAGISLVTVFVFIAMVSPSVSLRTVVDRFQALSRRGEEPIQSIAGSLGLESSPQTSGFDRIRYAGLPRSHLIGSGPELRDQLVMTVKETDLFPEVPGHDLGLPTTAYYWRSLTYDQYNGRGWETSPTEAVSYPEGHLLASSIPPGYRLIELDINGQENLGGLLYFAGTPVTVDKDIEIAWRGEPPVGAGGQIPPQPAGEDILGIRVDSLDYQVRSLVLSPGDTDLRASPAVYPDAIRVRYTSLPGLVPDRVFALARDLTITEPTPYEQALAIESYLRKIPYNLDLPAPPPDRDIADYFLFDLREGYCDYYATAMVVLSRAAGLPARIVIGYAAGRLDSETNAYQVTAADAHSWVEVYFPGFGWIEFEPTAGLPPLARSETGFAETTLESLDSLFDEAPYMRLSRWAGQSGSQVIRWLVLLVSLIGLVLFGDYLFPSLLAIRLSRLSVDETLLRIFSDLYRQGHLLGVPIQPGDTAYEFAKIFQTRFAMLVPKSNRRDQGSLFGQHLNVLVELFVRMIFSTRQVTRLEQVGALKSWVHLRGLLWGLRVRQILSDRFFHRIRVQKSES